VSGARPVSERVERFLDALEGTTRPEAWLHVRPREMLLGRAADLDGADPQRQPLRGRLFAVKDNIDVGGCPTTAGCPAFRYVPETGARVVTRLEAAGALAVGKTHLDQFATGLVGTRSPHGPCRNAHEPAFIAGGSSSGSAVVVALGLVEFALGTDTAGSGRVPAALNGVVGMKPSRGLLSTRGVVPACPSLDCVSIFARDCAEAQRVFAVARTEDATDPHSRAPRALARWPSPLRFALPPDDALAEVESEVQEGLREAERLLLAFGAKRVAVDWTPFREASALLYEGPWLAERQLSFGDFVATHPEAVDPTVRAILAGAHAISGRDAFRGLHALAVLRRQAERAFERLDVLVVPPVPRTLRIADVLGDPIATNSALGAFNHFVNLLDLSACVVPIAWLRCGVPTGVALCAPAFRDDDLLQLGARIEAARGPWPEPPRGAERVSLVVVGAHLSGMPLHGDLLALGARLERALRTAPVYRLFALPGARPLKPGLVRVGSGGFAIEAEVYSLAAAAFARFVDAIPAPLGIGRVALEDGSAPAGFLCEAIGVEGAEDVSSFGGWRSYLSRG